MSNLQDIEFEIDIEENLDEIIEEIELEILPIRDEDFQLIKETVNIVDERKFQKIVVILHENYTVESV